MKKHFGLKILLTCVMLLSALTLFGCSDDTIVIYTSAEDFRIEHMQKRLNEQFPDYNIVIEYKSSGDNAALLKSAGAKAGCHIFHDLEYGYAEEIAELGVFANLDNIVDESIFLDTTVVSDYYIPEVRVGGAIILNMDVIKEKKLDIPSSYEDLLDPQYKNLISMPNPKASGTGYIFLLSLVNAWGEEKAFSYFDKLSNNILSFTSSGSGPVNALVGREVAIGLGMTSQAVYQINNGENLKVVFFDEGSPYTLYGQGIIKGFETDERVTEVFKFLSTTITKEQNELFFPEAIFNGEAFVVENYPSDISYSDMTGNNAETKAYLLGKWSH